MSVDVALALGANLGDPADQLQRAVDRLAEWVEVRAVSSLYRTAPVGVVDQPNFLNLALVGVTDQSVYALHAAAQAIERDLGRVRVERNGPRMIDIDLLSYGPLVMVSGELVLPHPRLQERSFVLEPLAEIAPEWRHPASGRTAAELLSALRAPSKVLRVGSLRPPPPDPD